MKDKRLERTLALAGVVQAAAMVHRIAFGQPVPSLCLQASIRSIFNNRIQSPQDLFPEQSLHLGLTSLIQVFGQKDLHKEKLINRYWFAMIYLASKLRSDKKSSALLQNQIQLCERQLEHFGPEHDSTLLRLGDIWQQTLGCYRFKILVTGNTPSLQHGTTAAKIRACLLAGVRSAVLWEQLGGSQWQLLFQRQSILEAAKHLQRLSTEHLENA